MAMADVGPAQRMLRFAIVGAGAAILLFCLIYVFARLGFGAFTGSLLAYAIAFVVAYTAQRAWTFGARHDHAGALPRYFIVQAGCALLSASASHLMVTSLAVPPLIMAAMTTVTASAASYVLSSFWVFSDRRASRRA